MVNIGADHPGCTTRSVKKPRRAATGCRDSVLSPKSNETFGRMPSLRIANQITPRLFFLDSWITCQKRPFLWVAPSSLLSSGSVSMLYLGFALSVFKSALSHRCHNSTLSVRQHPGVYRRSIRRLAIERLEGRALLSMITVSNTDDAGAGSLRAAIETADLQAAQDTIVFAPSVTGTISLSTALPDLSTSMIIVGPGLSTLTVARSGVEGATEFGIFNVVVGIEVSISGLTITGGRGESGGGISNSGTLTLTDCTLSGNSANGGEAGGGIFNSGTGTLTLTDCTLSGNSANGGEANHGGEAGGIFNSGTGTLTLTDCTLSGNSANGGAANFGGAAGGGIFNSSFGTLTLTDCTLSGNSANGDGAGGGIFNSSFGTLTLTDCTLSGNSANGAPAAPAGGGIFNFDMGTQTLTDCTLSGNSANELPRRPRRWRHLQLRHGHADAHRLHTQRQLGHRLRRRWHRHQRRAGDGHYESLRQPFGGQPRSGSGH